MTLGRIATDVDSVKKAVDEGYRILRIGVDIPVVTRELRKIVQALPRPSFL